MRHGTTLFIRVVLILIGLCACAFLLWEPHIEGRNANATVFEIYFNDPFLAYVYVGSTPFFVGLFQAFKFLGYAGRNQEHSNAALKSVRTIKYSALTLIGFVAIGEVFILLNESDDRAGGVFMGMLFTVAAMAVATAMLILERTLGNAGVKSSKE